ncbi:hypothetical protein QR680_000551 [Steinernema hermaphroditum]|uniref:Uncharacterized protein n=1 Tax=Steinernema hermaphroditum TaxID=289476 RepID=A0AA39GVU1_9BILA|nr:hypothetical protein QR680_000551 [Steinernema hermaphroditum]
MPTAEVRTSIIHRIWQKLSCCGGHQNAINPPSNPPIATITTQPFSNSSPSTSTSGPRQQWENLRVVVYGHVDGPLGVFYSSPTNNNDTKQ